VTGVLRSQRNQVERRLIVCGASVSTPIRQIAASTTTQQLIPDKRPRKCQQEEMNRINQKSYHWTQSMQNVLRNTYTFSVCYFHTGRSKQPSKNEQRTTNESIDINKLKNDGGNCDKI
jgi:hypothetical protein